jgi:glycogen operon protein
MLLGGDEMGRTQGGNNNAYCQDNEVSWYDWEHVDEALLAFAQAIVGYRKAHPLFRRRRFFQGRPIRGLPGDDSALPDIAWFSPDGSEMTDDQWQDHHAQALTVFLNGDVVEVDRRGEPVVDDRLLLLLNGSADPVDFALPDGEHAEQWTIDVDTDTGAVLAEDAATLKAGSTLEVPGRSILVLRRDRSTSET